MSKHFGGGYPATEKEAQDFISKMIEKKVIKD